MESTRKNLKSIWYLIFNLNFKFLDSKDLQLKLQEQVSNDQKLFIMFKKA